MKANQEKVIINHHHDLKRGVDYIGVCCVFFCHDGKGNFLFHRRSANCRDEIGRWDPGGGALEFGETPEEAVKREVKEEYCVTPQSLEFGGARTVLRENNGTKTHWIAFVFSVLINPTSVAVGDPHKMDEVGWFSPTQLPHDIHSQTEASFELIKQFHRAC